jgi:hypothetical protein
MKTSTVESSAGSAGGYREPTPSQQGKRALKVAMIQLFSSGPLLTAD